jgi:thymidine kinase
MEKLGHIEFITGCMFSGKSSELIRRLRLESIAGRKIQCFKYSEDNRYSKEDISSHDKVTLKAIPVLTSKEIREYLEGDADVIGIDEVNLFDSKIVHLIEELSNEGKKVIVSGLDTDFRGETFPFQDDETKNIGNLLSKATRLIKLNAICTHKDNGIICGNVATRTQRLTDRSPANYTEPTKKIGAKESYEARCLIHHIVPGKPSFS